MFRIAGLVSSIVLLGCTRPNPGFGDDGGATSDVTSDPTLDPSGESLSASTGTSMSDSDPTADTSDTANETDGMRRCGDGVKDEDLGEECDEGDDSNRDDGPCLSDCRKNVCGDLHTSPTQPCDDGPRGSNVCTPDCQLRSCGNGRFDEGAEECEPGLAKPEVCTLFCTLNECGDMQVLGDEQCDDGNGDSGDECVDCVLAYCGDMQVHQGREECDDANPDDTDQCTNQCLHAQCGDGVILDGTEQCDSNQLLSCEDFELQGTPVSCDQRSCQLIGCTNCGDGVVEGDEVCEPDAFVACIGEGGDEFVMQCSSECTWPDASTCCIPGGSPCELGLECCNGLCDDGVCPAG